MEQVLDNKKAEYSDMILYDIRLHGNDLRKPKEWYPKLVRAARRGVGERTYTNHFKLFMTEDGYIGFELTFQVGKEIRTIYNESLNSGKGFRILTPKAGIRVYPDKNLIERVKAHNKKAGFQHFRTDEIRGKLSTFDIKDGTVTMKVVLQ